MIRIFNDLVLTDAGNVSFSIDESGNVTANSTGGGVASWGTIVGVLATQLDLQAALDAKAAASHTHPKTQIDGAGTWEADEIPNLDAAKITSGQFPIARLASGAPDGTKFVRDDGTLATPAGGGGGPAKVRQAADQTATNATLVNVTNLVFALTANTTSAFRFLVLFRSTLATVGLKLGLTFPAVTDFGCTVRVPIAGAGAGGELQGPITASGGSVVGSAVPAINTTYCAIVDGVIRPSANGNLQLQFAAETTGSVTLEANSVGLLETFA